MASYARRMEIGGIFPCFAPASPLRHPVTQPNRHRREQTNPERNYSAPISCVSGGSKICILWLWGILVMKTPLVLVSWTSQIYDDPFNINRSLHYTHLNSYDFQSMNSSTALTIEE